MLNDSGIGLPPRGGGIVIQVDVMPAAHVTRDHLGIVVSRDGRVALCTETTGLGVKLDALEAAALGHLLLKISNALAEEAEDAATAASAALSRITREVAGNA